MKQKDIKPEDIINLIDDLIFLKDLDGIYQNCNKAYLEYFNKNMNEIVGKNDFEIFNKKTAINFIQSDNELLKNKITKTYDERIYNKEETIYLETIKTIVYDKKNNPIGILGISRDITIRKQYEILYQENQIIFEMIIKKEPLEEILNTVINFVEEKCPNVMCSILFLNKDKKRIEKAIAPSLPNSYIKNIKGIKIAAGVAASGTAAFLKKRVIIENINTHPYWQAYKYITNEAGIKACCSQPIFSSIDEILGTFTFYYKKSKRPSSYELRLIDSFSHLCSIAMQKDIDEKEFKEKNLLLIHQSKMASLGEMLENIAHQWRQPLSLISTCASAVKIQREVGVLNEDLVDEALDNILNSTKYLTKTIDDFRSFFLKNRSKKDFFIKKTIEKVLNLTSAKFKNKEINFIKDIEDLPIFGFENELLQVLINILNNAEDALILNDIKNKLIFINVYKKNNDCIIEIKDNANGIPQHIIEKVFEPYFTTKHKSQGTGIGLYMSQEIISKHMYGKIEVKNTNFFFENKQYYGALFKITLPLK
ncbi:hypothetical protein CRU99_13020 [Malaciobacter mytili]|uniref:sensor histidine kinase n=1 Tax=Malaciobacter mytili TaxID=603050 RepID=UPI00100BBA24|nr:GAF domain-containing sensor histidine kinase [Malaciobacter mytili]RXI36959.1 hypothetical protein CRU99_13020 [Malaciobacter mytili]